MGGLMIGSDRSLKQVAIDGVTQMWISRLTSRDEAGKAHWRVVAIQEVPPLDTNESLVWVDCGFSGVADPAIVAIGTWQRSPSVDSLVNIRRAWRPSPDADRFEDLLPSEITCIIDEDRL